jgi:hypothetical protein
VLINDLKIKLRTYFYTFDVVYCKREFNRPAHELARIGWSSSVNRVMLWEFQVPAPIDGLVLDEMPQ